MILKLVKKSIDIIYISILMLIVIFLLLLQNIKDILFTPILKYRASKKHKVKKSPKSSLIKSIHK